MSVCQKFSTGKLRDGPDIVGDAGTLPANSGVGCLDVRQELDLAAAVAEALDLHPLLSSRVNHKFAKGVSSLSLRDQ
jgi:hypothetical protein